MIIGRAISIIPRLILVLALLCAARPPLLSDDTDQLPQRETSLASPIGISKAILLRSGSDQKDFSKANLAFHAPQLGRWLQTSQTFFIAEEHKLFYLPSILRVSPSRSPPVSFAS
jgi:hypothetical protein